MSNIQIHSIGDPLNAPELARVAVATLIRAEAMGLLPENEILDRLDLATLQKVAKAISRAGIGHGIAVDLTVTQSRNPQHLSATLQKLNEALDESPMPSREWPGLMNILGADLLARLVGISPSSVRRYLSGVRSTPDDIAARLHFLALVVGDLAGAYNNIGIRRWFERSRTLLSNRSPLQIFSRKWRPEDPGPQQVRQLAHALLASPVT
jgi:transcriptional regulator with XRE-family HTH domain